MYIEGQFLWLSCKCDCGVEEEVAIRIDKVDFLSAAVRRVRENFTCERCNATDTYYQDVVSEWYYDR